ncbi:MAG: hypothetical protein ACI97A_002727 [Planctomycetota bacterium]|jgi:hypothetical protein
MGEVRIPVVSRQGVWLGFHYGHDALCRVICSRAKGRHLSR